MRFGLWLRKMKLKSLLFVSMIVAATSAGQGSRSGSSGGYTQEQADRGKTAYGEHCASCHGAKLGGGDEAPALTGDEFMASWRGRTSDALSAKIQASMPPDRPGALGRQTDSDIAAFILAANKVPAGAAAESASRPEVATSTSKPS